MEGFEIYLVWKYFMYHETRSIETFQQFFQYFVLFKKCSFAAIHTNEVQIQRYYIANNCLRKYYNYKTYVCVCVWKLLIAVVHVIL